MSRKYGFWFYVGYVFVWALAITAGATIVGAIAFPILGKLGGSDLTIGKLALNGARYLAQWTGEVWAIGTALVLAFNHAYHHRRTPNAKRDDHS